MKTPKNLTGGDFFMVVQSFLADRCSSAGRTHGLTCTYCGSQILTKAVAVQLHEADPNRCIETGVVQPIRIPHCPKCEFPPISRGCIHVPSPAAFLEWCSLSKDVGQLILIDGKPLAVVSPKKPTQKYGGALRILLPVRAGEKLDQEAPRKRRSLAE